MNPSSPGRDPRVRSGDPRMRSDDPRVRSGDPRMRSDDPRARSELRRRRDELAEQVAELHWDLGGLTYEMAIRDHFRLDLLVRHAAALQGRDAELAEVERLLRLEDSASAGSCSACAAPHSRGALFCWQCGTTLMERAPSSALPVPAGRGRVLDDTVEDTLVIDPVSTSEA